MSRLHLKAEGTTLSTSTALNQMRCPAGSQKRARVRLSYTCRLNSYFLTKHYVTWTVELCFWEVQRRSCNYDDVQIPCIILTRLYVYTSKHAYVETLTAAPFKCLLKAYMHSTCRHKSECVCMIRPCVSLIPDAACFKDPSRSRSATAVAVVAAVG